MNLINILDTDDYIVDYDKENKRYRVSFFENYNFVDEVWFDEYNEE